jgi:hypothetical protein
MVERSLPAVGPLVLAVVSVLALASCSDAPGPASVTVPAVSEGELMIGYDFATGARQEIITGNPHELLPDIPAVNGPICFSPRDQRLFVVASDETQPDPPPHWWVLRLTGDQLGGFSYEKVGRLFTEFQGGIENADPYGCGWLSDGRILTTDIGNNRSGPSSGQLIVWFPPFDVEPVKHCKLDVEIGTAQQIYVGDDDTVYVAASRNDSGVFRYTGPFPTSADAAGGCGRIDDTGEPLADHVSKEKLIAPDGHIPVPSGITGSGHGTFYLSSVVAGAIAEYDADGRFLRTILEPPAGEHLGPVPIPTGTPLGLCTAGDGTLYYADIGLVVDGGGVGPGNATGTFRQIRFANGVPLPPETLASGLRFPDGCGVIELH